MIITLRRPFTKKDKSCIEIARVSSKINCIVRGGFSKLMKSVILWAKEQNYDKIITYSDCRYSTGNTYKQFGFIYKNHTGINYYYTDLFNRFNRFKFRAKDNKSEKQIALENNVHKIYGAGNYLWEYIINT